MAWTTSADPRGIILSALRGVSSEPTKRDEAHHWPRSKPVGQVRTAAGSSSPGEFTGSAPSALPLPFTGLLAIHAIAVIAAIASVETLWPVIVLAVTSTALTLHLFSQHRASSQAAPDEHDGQPERPSLQTGQAAFSFQAEHKQQHRASNAPVEGLADEPANWCELMQRVSHELRTPLNAVIGFSDLMQNETFGPLGSPRYQEYARFIRDSGDALLKSTEDTLAMTSALTAANNRKSANPGSQPLYEAIDGAWTRISQRPENSGLELSVACDREVEIIIDSRPLRQILINLLSEAAARARQLPPAQRGAISIKVSVDHDLVQIEFSTPSANAARDAYSLDLCVARALLELQGTSLLLIDNPTVGWRAITVLDRAAQADFFQRDTALTDVRHLRRPADTVRNVA